jgi:predicted porin
MKHTLIAVAAAGLASAAVVTPAMADATAYGLAQVELTSYSNQSEGACTADGTAASGSDSGSDVPCDGLKLQDKANGRLGIKASEDLGNGWTSLAKAEWQVNYAKGEVNSNRDAFHSRELMVGLKGSGVEFQAGQLKSAYKYTGGVKYDPFVATALEARRDNGGMSHTAYGQGGFLPETIAVVGKAGPIKYWLTYGPGEGDGDMTASVMYSQGDVEAFVAMADKGERAADTLPPVGGGIGNASADYSAQKIGGAYKMGPTKIKLQYEMIDNGGTADPTYMFLGVEHKMGKNTFVAQLGAFDSDGGTNDTSYTAIGVIHKFTKMTRIFAGFRT